MQQSPQNSSKIITSHPESSFPSVENDQLNSPGKKQKKNIPRHKYFRANNN